MIRSQAENRTGGTPGGDHGTGALGRLAATVLAASLATLSLVAAGPVALDPFEQVLTKQKVVVKPAPADQPVAAKKVVLGQSGMTLHGGNSDQPIAAKKVVVARPRVVNANANQNPMIQRLVQQGKPLVYAELLFARGLCKLDQPTLAKIYPETLQVLDDVAKKLANDQMKARRPDANHPDAESLLQQGLAAIFKKHLRADQYRLFESESARRIETRRKAAIRFMIDLIDREVHFSSDQRAKITEAITKNWNESWTIYLEYVLRGNQFFPDDIDQYVRPVLTENQRMIWQGTQKVQLGWTGFGRVMMFNGQEPPIPALLGIETKDEAAQRGLVTKRQAAELEARNKAMAERIKKADEARKATEAQKATKK